MHIVNVNACKTKVSRWTTALLVTSAALWMSSCSDEDAQDTQSVGDASIETDARAQESDQGATQPPDAAPRDSNVARPDITPMRCDDPAPPSPDSDVRLPADDGVHESALEWWYWTGHLQDEAGRWYGFQVTFFLMGSGATRGSLVNVALTDIERGTFDHVAKFALAPMTPVENGIDFAFDPHTAQGGDGHDVVHVELTDATLDLELTATRPPLLQHGGGFIEYPFGGHTYYYSRTRMETTGTLHLDGESRTVSGQAWFDHQWGDLAAATERGWDWFAIQLEDGRDIMIFLVHGDEGEQALPVGRTLRTADCAVREIAPEQLTVTAQGTWTSPESGCTYPSGWTVEIDGERFNVTPVLEDQEIHNARDPSTTYWEGASRVTGDGAGRAYVELTGYCGR